MELPVPSSTATLSSSVEGSSSNTMVGVSPTKNASSLPSERRELRSTREHGNSSPPHTRARRTLPRHTDVLNSDVARRKERSVEKKFGALEDDRDDIYEGRSPNPHMEDEEYGRLKGDESDEVNEENEVDEVVRENRRRAMEQDENEREEGDSLRGSPSPGATIRRRRRGGRQLPNRPKAIAVYECLMNKETSSLRKIAQMLGHSRESIKTWVKCRNDFALDVVVVAFEVIFLRSQQPSAHAEVHPTLRVDRTVNQRAMTALDDFIKLQISQNFSISVRDIQRNISNYLFNDEDIVRLSREHIIQSAIHGGFYLDADEEVWKPSSSYDSQITNSLMTLTDAAIGFEPIPTRSGRASHHDKGDESNSSRYRLRTSSERKRSVRLLGDPASNSTPDVPRTRRRSSVKASNNLRGSALHRLLSDIYQSQSDDSSSQRNESMNNEEEDAGSLSRIEPDTDSFNPPRKRRNRVRSELQPSSSSIAVSSSSFHAESGTDGLGLYDRVVDSSGSSIAGPVSSLPFLSTAESNPIVLPSETNVPSFPTPRQQIADRFHQIHSHLVFDFGIGYRLAEFPQVSHEAPALNMSIESLSREIAALFGWSELARVRFTHVFEDRFLFSLRDIIALWPVLCSSSQGSLCGALAAVKVFVESLHRRMATFVPTFSPNNHTQDNRDLTQYSESGENVVD